MSRSVGKNDISPVLFRPIPHGLFSPLQRSPLSLLCWGVALLLAALGMQHEDQRGGGACCDSDCLGSTLQTFVPDLHGTGPRRDVRQCEGTPWCAGGGNAGISPTGSAQTTASLMTVCAIGWVSCPVMVLVATLATPSRPSTIVHHRSNSTCCRVMAGSFAPEITGCSAARSQGIDALQG